MVDKVCVTDDPAFAEYLREQGMIDSFTEVIPLAALDDVRDSPIQSTSPSVSKSVAAMNAVWGKDVFAEDIPISAAKWAR